MPDEPQIQPVDPGSPEVRVLVDRHWAFARASTPPQDIYALDHEKLADAAVTLYGLRVDGALLAMGAIRGIDADHAELKSMHVASEARGRGYGRAMLDHLLGVARERGYERVSIETGSSAPFAPAIALYTRAGFVECPPFSYYREGPNSLYMTRLLLEAPARDRHTDDP